MWLSTCHRENKDLTQAKKFLELADVNKITDHNFLLKFYIESSKQYESCEQYNQALDSMKKAFDTANRIYREDDFSLMEL